MEKESLISIIIPVYNRQELVKDALDSVLAQTYQAWECIVIDDGSTDDTWTVLKKYAQKDNRFKIHKRNREPKGAPTCRNIGISLAQGEYVIFLDSDDMLAPDCLSFRIKSTKIYPEYSVWIFDTSIFRKHVGDDDRMWNVLYSKENDLVRYLKSDPVWSISGPLWLNASILSFDETAIAAQDWEYHVRFLLTNKSYKKIGSSPKNSHVYCRRNIELLTISTTKKIKEDYFLISLLATKVIKQVINKSHSSTIRQEAVNSLLRLAIEQKKRGLKKESMSTWTLAKISDTYSKTNYHLWRVYIKLYNKHTFKYLEFIAYRLLKKASVLNNTNTVLK